MNFIQRFFKYVKRELAIKKEVNQHFDTENIALLEIEEKQKVPSREHVLAQRTLSSLLRKDSERYHKASLKYLSENPGKDFIDFDNLQPESQKIYFQ